MSTQNWDSVDDATSEFIGQSVRSTFLTPRAYEYGENSIYYDPQNGIRNFVKEFADRLRSHGDSILRGDLSTLPAMEKIIKKRAEDLRTT